MPPGLPDPPRLPAHGAHSAHAPEARPASAVGAMARGTAAIGSAVVGGLAVAGAAIGRLAVHRARVRRLEIDELVVGSMRIGGQPADERAPATALPALGASDATANAPGAIARAQVVAWIDAYERAWRTAGTDALARLFTDEATYSRRPYSEPLQGLAAIAVFWAEERDGPEERFRMRSELVAVEGDTAVARVEVDYAGEPPIGYRDLWVMTFAPDGRCRAYEEWPFAPGQRAAPDA